MTERELQIERTISREMGVSSAQFRSMDINLCIAVVFGTRHGIECTRERLTIEQAGALSIALQMAVEWIAEESAQRSATP